MTSNRKRIAPHQSVDAKLTSGNASSSAPVICPGSPHHRDHNIIPSASSSSSSSSSKSINSGSPTPASVESHITIDSDKKKSSNALNAGTSDPISITPAFSQHNNDDPHHDHHHHHHHHHHHVIPDAWNFLPVKVRKTLKNVRNTMYNHISHVRVALQQHEVSKHNGKLYSGGHYGGSRKGNHIFQMFKDLAPGKSILVTLLFLLGIVFLLHINLPSKMMKHLRTADVRIIEPSNDGNLLILTPMKDASPWLDEYFDNLVHLNYPKEKTSLAFLVSDSGDNTLRDLKEKAKQLPRYADITILNKDFNFSLPNELRHSFEGQLVRRSFLAKSRNYLLSMALQPKHDYVLWLDVDVTRYDPNTVLDLMSLDKDVAVPNTLWHRKDSWEFWGFDRNNWQETEESTRFRREILKGNTEILLIEGYRELMTYRMHLVDMPTHMGLAHVPLDGIGCTFALVKSQVHREGVMFPTYVFDNEIETEGFAKMAKRAGFEVVGVPGLLVFHAENH